MHISEDQIEAVVKVLINNEYRLSDSYRLHYNCNKEGRFYFDGMEDEYFLNLSLDNVLREIAISIIEDLNEVIYYKGL